MPALTTLILAATLSLTPVTEIDLTKRIDVDCQVEGALERALAKVSGSEADIYLNGVCKGSFVIAHDGVTLRAGTPGSGLAAPLEASPSTVVLEVANARASLRGIVVRGGGVGVLVDGWDADVLLIDADVHGQDGIGVWVRRGARVRVLDSTLHDAGRGLVAENNSVINLQNVTIHDQDVGVTVSDKSTGAINDSTIENNRSAGLNVIDRSDVNVLGGVFRENGQVHINANDWSSINLLLDVAIGSETDATPGAIGSNRKSLVSSFSAPAIHGDVSALIGGSIQMGNTVVHGDLLLFQFADAFVRNSEITGNVACRDGAQAVCRGVTSAGVLDCPAATCGSPVAGAADPAPTVPEFSVVEVPRPEPVTKLRSRR